MPINPLQLPQKAPKKDALDKILAGLQIAETAFKIPVAYEQIRNYAAEAGMKEAQASGAPIGSDWIKAGHVPVSREQAKELGAQFPVDEQGNVAPDHAPLMPGQYGPEDPNASYGPKISLLPTTKDGQKVLMPMLDMEAKKQQEEKLGKYREGYTKEFEDIGTAMLNYKLVDSSYDKALGGDKAKQQELLTNTARLINPGITRAVDGSSLSANDSLPEELKKFYNKLTGQGSAALLPHEVREIRGIADDAIKGRLTQGYAVNTKYSDFAKGDRIDPAKLGLADLSETQQLFDKGSAKNSSYSKGGSGGPGPSLRDAQNIARDILDRRKPKGQ